MGVSMIFFDTETTGLPKAEAASLSEQPHMTEIYAVKLDDDFNFIADFKSLVKVPVPVPEIITKITGINDKMLEDQPKFSDIYNELVNLFLGETTMVAHNIAFDAAILRHELRRLDMHFKFPWPQKWICTVEKSMHIRGHRLKLTQLHEIATGKPHDEKAHRAEEDVAALVRCFMWLREKGEV
jgi:DNA polymerase III epsilon subunit-like protein